MAPSPQQVLSPWIRFGALLLVALLSTAAAPVEQVADGDYVHFGQVAVGTDDTANLGIIVGRDAAAVIDTGGSVATGRALLAALRQLTDKPLRYVINTHEHPDHVFGNAAFAGTGVTFAGHHALPASLHAHGPFYLHSFAATLGAEAIAEVRLIPPGLLVETTMELDLGDRTLLLTAWHQAAHSDCDLTVLDEHTPVVRRRSGLSRAHARHGRQPKGLAGGVAPARRGCRQPRGAGARPTGRGLAAALDDERRYLLAVQADARRLIASGVSMAEAVPHIGDAERGRWRLFDDYAPRNATAAFSELEWE